MIPQRYPQKRPGVEAVAFTVFSRKEVAVITKQKIEIAEDYLRRFADRGGPLEYYVLNAHQHGIPVERISELMRVPLNRVALIVKEK